VLRPTMLENFRALRNFSRINLEFTRAKTPRTQSDGPVIPSKMLAI